MPYQAPPALWRGSIEVTLQIKNARPQMHELLSGPYSVVLVVLYCQFHQGCVVIGLEISISSNGVFEAYATFSLSPKEQPVRTANFIRVLGWYESSGEQIYISARLEVGESRSRMRDSLECLHGFV